MVPMHSKKRKRAFHEPNVGQAFQPAGSPDFPVRWTKNGRLEIRPNPQAGKPALRANPDSCCQCRTQRPSGHSTNLDLFSAIELTVRPAVPVAPGRRARGTGNPQYSLRAAGASSVGWSG